MPLNGARWSDRVVGVRAPSDANGSGRAQVSEIQRARILGGMVEVVCERGAGEVTVAHVVERSGVSRRTFYEQFDDREECFLAAFEQAVAYAGERVLPAYEIEGRWQERVRAALGALLTFLDDEPAIARLLIVESLAGGARPLQRRGRVLSQIVSAIEGGREQAKTGSAAPPLTGEGVVGGVLSVLHARIVEDDRELLADLLNPLMSMVVMPYLGSVAARRELGRPVVASSGSRQEAVLLSDPFKDAGMRLTYRTMRVLMTIAERPACSNRIIGENAGIKDQGQISKLLARLERIGLISNSGLGPGEGAPNAWSLTSRGRHVAQSIRAHTHSSNPEGEALRRGLLDERS